MFCSPVPNLKLHSPKPSLMNKLTSVISSLGCPPNFSKFTEDNAQGLLYVAE